MKTIIDYLNDLKEKNSSDYKTAQLLNIEKSAISNIRRRQLMSDETAIKVADLLGIDRNEVLIAAAIARSKGEVKTTWEKISRMSGFASVLMMSGAIAMGTLPYAHKSSVSGIYKPNMYIMLNNAHHKLCS